MANNKKIVVGELDYDSIKSNLVTFMQGQTEFSDYNFTGSSLNILMDILSYNTHYNAVYQNLAINEMFLDSASKRNSVVSRARELGYLPSSSVAPIALITMVVNGSGITASIVNLPKFSTFTTTIDGNDYTYMTINDISAVKDPVSGNFIFTNVSIYEGYRLQYSQIVSASTRYILPNKGLDLSTLKVSVLENSSNGTYVTYSKAEDLLAVKSTSKVFFLKEIDNQLYEFQFGDGVLGFKLQNGMVVNYDYLVTNGPASGGAKVFSFQGNLGGVATITTTQASSGGSAPEDIESIRFNAPRYYATQNRAVTYIDYEAIIKKYYIPVESINVWGGENNVPPVYGKVFICIKPFNAVSLTSSEKERIKTQILKNKAVARIIPEFIDPEYINIQLFTTVYYNPKMTPKSADDIKLLAIQTAIDYNANNLTVFDSIFRFSQYSSKIDACERSVVGNISRIILQRPVQPKYNIIATYVIPLGNPIYTTGKPENSITSNGIMIAGDNTNIYYIDDDGIGNLRLYYIIGNTTKTYVNNTLGTVDYINGIIKINGLNISSLAQSDFTLSIKPNSYDVLSLRNQLVRIPQNLINVNVIVNDTTESDTAINNFIFTPSIG